MNSKRVIIHVQITSMLVPVRNKILIEAGLDIRKHIEKETNKA